MCWFACLGTVEPAQALSMLQRRLMQRGLRCVATLRDRPVSRPSSASRPRPGTAHLASRCRVHVARPPFHVDPRPSRTTLVPQFCCVDSLICRGFRTGGGARHRLCANPAPLRFITARLRVCSNPSMAGLQEAADSVVGWLPPVPGGGEVGVGADAARGGPRCARARAPMSRRSGPGGVCTCRPPGGAEPEVAAESRGRAPVADDVGRADHAPGRTSKSLLRRRRARRRRPRLERPALRVRPRSR